MVQYLHFRILKFPFILGNLQIDLPVNMAQLMDHVIKPVVQPSSDSRLALHLKPPKTLGIQEPTWGPLESLEPANMEQLWSKI